MGIKRKFFDFVIFSNLFIALCAVIMVAHSYHLFSGVLPPFNLTGFIFFSTLASYSIHWYLTDETVEITASRTDWLSRNKKIHIAFFIISAIGCGFFLLREIHYLKFILPAIALTVMYSAPKLPFAVFKKLAQFVIGKTILLAAMWTYVTAILPVLITVARGSAGEFLYIINRFFLLFAICILFDLRDREYDKTSGVKSLITHLEIKQVKTLFSVVLIVSITTSALLAGYFKSTAAAITLAVPAVLTFVLYNRATQTNNDYLFYFILDGLMALAGVLYFILN